MRNPRKASVVAKTPAQEQAIRALGEKAIELRDASEQAIKAGVPLAHIVEVLKSTVLNASL